MNEWCFRPLLCSRLFWLIETGNHSTTKDEVMRQVQGGNRTHDTGDLRRGRYPCATVVGEINQKDTPYYIYYINKILCITCLFRRLIDKEMTVL